MKKLIPQKSTENKNSGAALYKDMEADTLARTLWGEARSEGTRGMHAVANVVQNRVRVAQRRRGFWWGNNIIQVCQKPYQFSCWNNNDPNRAKIIALTEDDIYFATALRIARRAVHNCLEDITEGATHYHTRSIMPYWAKGEKACTTIGRHIFYNLESV